MDLEHKSLQPGPSRYQLRGCYVFDFHHAEKREREDASGTLWRKGWRERRGGVLGTMTVAKLPEEAED